MTFSSVINVLLVAFAFGFVIFWHELGHFLAARWAKVRVEQFAVGMGQALFSYRKGIGVRAGNTQAEYDRRVDEEIAKRGTGRLPSEYSPRERYDIGKEIGLGETDYRFNWIPLGGYVKPTGQDDLRPAALVGADDPHAFGAKPVGKRMVIICAGVVMNIILAFALYVALFMYGFNAPPSCVGMVLPGSPAEAAGLMPGDRIISINGQEQQDFTKLRMNIALLRNDEAAIFEVERTPGQPPIALSVSPTKSNVESGMSSIGISGAETLEAVATTDAETNFMSPEIDAMPAGSRVVRIGDRDVSKEKDSHLLIEATQASHGRPIDLTIRRADGSEHAFEMQPSLMAAFNSVQKDDPRTIAGMQPRVRIAGVQRNAPADKAGLKPGDIVEQIAIVQTNAALRPVSVADFIEWTSKAGAAGNTVRVTVIRDGRMLPPIDVTPSKIGGQYRMGVLPDLDLGEPVIARVMPGSAAAAATLTAGDKIVSIDGNPTPTWPDVLAGLSAMNGADSVEIRVTSERGERVLKMDRSAETMKAINAVAFQPTLALAQLIEPRRTTSPVTAARWGYEETKASILQVYVTLRRLVEGQVPLSNLSGPVGIFSAGTSAASRGIDWLIWFTALISANLAVVNFLPMPIVDGGLFLFLLAEKITGRPPSPRVQTAAQVAGILLLGSLFLFVTYHDILRQIG